MTAPGIAIPFGPAPAPHLRGMTAREAARLQATANQTKSTIVVRDSNPARLQHVAGENTRPKPQAVKQKTNRAGLVQRDDENRLLDEQGNTYHSDLDMHGVYGPDGRHWPEEDVVDKLNRGLAGSGRSRPHNEHLLPPSDLGARASDKVQHGAHDQWAQRNDPAMGPNRGPQPGATFYRPGAPPIHTDTAGQYRETLPIVGVDPARVYSDASWDAAADRQPKRPVDEVIGGRIIRTDGMAPAAPPATVRRLPLVARPPERR